MVCNGKFMLGHELSARLECPDSEELLAVGHEVCIMELPAALKNMLEAFALDCELELGEEHNRVCWTELKRRDVQSVPPNT